MTHSNKLLSKDQLSQLLKSEETQKVFGFYGWQRQKIDADYFTLDELSNIIFYMQADLQKFKVKNPGQVERINTAQGRINKLEAIRDQYQSFHFTAEYYIKKSYELECNNLELCYKINELQEEIEKLKQTLNTTNP